MEWNMTLDQWWKGGEQRVLALPAIVEASAWPLRKMGWNVVFDWQSEQVVLALPAIVEASA